MVKDTLGDLVRDLSIQKAGWHRAEGPGGAAYFPETAKDVEAWEARCSAMHHDQQTFVPEAKPEHGGLRKIVRGD